MKMEGDILKLSSSKTTDTGGLTFGPAWYRLFFFNNFKFYLSIVGILKFFSV